MNFAVLSTEQERPLLRRARNERELVSVERRREEEEAVLEAWQGQKFDFFWTMVFFGLVCCLLDSADGE